MTSSSQYGANTLQTTRNSEAASAEVTPASTAAGVRISPAMHRPANFIESASGGIERDSVIGASMIASVSMSISRDWRVTSIAFVSIPLSSSAASVTLDAMGQTINTMTSGGLAVASGVVIDDAIVDIENIVRRSRGVPDSADRRAIIEAASVEVRAPVVYATFVSASTMVPVISSTGSQGAFFAPSGLAFSSATMASSSVALTVTPALASSFSHGHEPRPEPALSHRFKQRHEGLV
ncbi:hypothetical protein OY671_008859, partial [Metschnikowia pulcherrima]